LWKNIKKKKALMDIPGKQLINYYKNLRKTEINKTKIKNEKR